MKEAASAFGFDVSAADELIDWTLASIKLEQREREIINTARETAGGTSTERPVTEPPK